MLEDIQYRVGKDNSIDAINNFMCQENKRVSIECFQNFSLILWT